MAYKIRYHHNFKLKKSDQETPRGKSMTIPGQTYSIKELLIRYSKDGEYPKNLYRDPMWTEDAQHEDQDLEKINNMDITDKNIIKEDNQITLHQMIEQIEEKQEINQQNKKVEDSKKLATTTIKDENIEKVQKVEVEKKEESSTI